MARCAPGGASGPARLRQDHGGEHDEAAGHEHGHAHGKPAHAEGAAHDEFDPQDMRNMGGLRKRMGVTFWVYLIGALALAGIAPLSGFFSKDEILGFSRFLNGKFVVKTFHFEDRIYFTFSMNRSLVNLEDPKEVSYAVIDFDGNVSVAISEKDYKDYVNRFSFDQVCSSIATIFGRFLDYYKEGLESRIITELKTAR